MRRGAHSGTTSLSSLPLRAAGCNAAAAACPSSRRHCVQLDGMEWHAQRHPPRALLPSASCHPWPDIARWFIRTQRLHSTDVKTTLSCPGGLSPDHASRCVSSPATVGAASSPLSTPEVDGTELLCLPSLMTNPEPSCPAGEDDTKQ